MGTKATSLDIKSSGLITLGQAQLVINEDEQVNRQAVATLATRPANEAGQTLSVQVSSNNNPLFADGPSMNPAGELSFVPVNNANGSAAFSVTLSDDGGTQRGGQDTSTPRVLSFVVGDGSADIAVTGRVLNSVSGGEETVIYEIVVSNFFRFLL